MNAYTCTYTLRNGVRGVLTLLASSSTAAIVVAIDLFGERLRSASARPGLAHAGADTSRGAA